MTDISIIIPVYNEEGNIGKLIDNILSKIKLNKEIIIVNDGSTDNTIEEIKSKNCKIINLEKNMGKGFAMREGIKLSSGNYILFMGGDGQDDPKEIILLYEKIKNNYDLVIGSRFLPTQNNTERYSKKAVLPINEIGNRFITFLINIFFKRKITDSQAEFKIFLSSKLKSLTLISDRFEIETELLIRSFKNNFKIIELPVHRHERLYGKSKLFDIPFGRLLFGMRVIRAIIKGYFFWK
ncbi:glycosyltransferase family 2 protein [Candidatus Pelagibacter sp.]|nr:glycosyltransferase family 2 protein [Candidatus Pelagibacter sp.]